jgi:glucose/arabinose dehydrogenase
MALFSRSRCLLAAALLAASGWVHALQGEVVASGLSQSLFVTAPTGDGRLFVVEKGGTIRILSGGTVQASAFLDLRSQVATQGERGLLGLAFDPGYAVNGRFYVNYIDRTTLNTVVARYTVADPASNVVDPASAQIILSIPQPGFSNHKAGRIAFRPGDASNLYIATGDGGSGNDPFNNGQNPNTLLGKMLRIDVSGDGPGYAIPTDNPFVGQPGTRPELWALGLRNPFRNSFDRLTGDLWMGDVGQNTREEINFEAASDPGGHNYGWRLREGTVPTPGVGGNAPGLTDPIFEYTHLGTPGGLGNSVTGGYVYRGPSIPGADGRYFFGDFISNRVFSFLLGAGNTPFDLRDDTAALLGGTGLSGLASFGEDGLGQLYAVGINGVVVRVVPEPASLLMLAMGLAVCLAWVRRSPPRRARAALG